MYRTYLKEQVEGTRVVLVAFYEGNFVVYSDMDQYSIEAHSTQAWWTAQILQQYKSENS